MNNLLVFLLSFILPRRYWYRNYYLRSRHWREIRYVKLGSVNYRCEQCREHMERGLDVHHLTYVHIWHERLNELQALCRPCHKEQHA